MNRRILSGALFLAISIWTASCHHAHFVIVSTGGSPQSTIVGTAFAAPLVALVTNAAGQPVAGVLVTFTAPSSGASATFSGGANKITVATNSAGVASVNATANGTVGGPYTVTATVITAHVPADFVLTNTTGIAAGLSCTSGNNQSTQVSTPFTNPLAVQVVDSGGDAVADPGVLVTFTPPATGASATFAGGVNTATTNASGLATSVAVSANAVAGGPYNVQASATIGDSTQTCNFSLTNTAIPITTENFVFYATGQEEAINDAPNFYAVAGAVTIQITGPDPGQVMAGEEDYNDGIGFTFTDVAISGGQLTVDSSTGQGTITLVTGNDSFGGFTTPAGTQEFAVQFVNADHALVIQFDGTATSSGSMDLQSSTSAPSGKFAFNFAGVDSNYCPDVFGGVFSISGTSLSGTFDVQDCATSPVTGIAFPAGVTVNATDAFGRGTIDANITADDTTYLATAAYYVVGSEVLRFVDIDAADTGVGSVFGQGTGTFSNSSLGTFVFEDLGNPWAEASEATGMITTNPDGGTFSGVGDLNEDGAVFAAHAIPSEATSYSIASNGYGGLTIPDGNFGDVTQFGIYMTDPKLNLNDPNNTASGTGGALLVDLSENTFGTGVITPQTATSSSSGNYAFGAQGVVSPDTSQTPDTPVEFDFLGQGTISKGTLSGSGDLDNFSSLYAGNNTLTGVAFAGTATADGENPGRYTMPLSMTPAGDAATDFSIAIYVAGAGQLFMIDDDTTDYFLGPVEQQAGTVTPLAIVGAKPIQKK